MQLNNGDRTPIFFERAVNHCYAQLEQLLGWISITPHRFRKPLYRKKGQLQREAKYLESKLKEYGLRD